MGKIKALTVWLEMGTWFLYAKILITSTADTSFAELVCEGLVLTSNPEATFWGLLVI